MISPRRFGHRAPLLWIVLPYIAGLAAAGNGPEIPPVPLLCAAALAACASVAAAGSSPRAWAFLLVAAVLPAGYAGCLLHRRIPAGWDSLPPREIRVLIRVEETFASGTGRGASGTGVIVAAGRHVREIEGRRASYSLALRAGQSAPEPSAVAELTGILSVAGRDAAPGTRWNSGTPAVPGANFRLTRGRLVRIASPPTRRRRLCERLAGRMNAILNAGLEGRPDVSAVYRAMMLGRKQDLSAGQRSAFLRSGTMHLFAINGLHIGVVALALHALLALARCPRPVAAAIVLSVLWLDVETTGASPSAVRAFLMIAFLEAARILRRPANPIAAIAAAALPVLLAAPMDLFGASFQMSYGVLTAILTAGLPLAEWLPARYPACRHVPAVLRSPPQRWRAAAQRHLLGGAGVGIAAALVGALTGVRFFGILSPAGLPIGLILAPLAALVIVAGFLSLASGLAAQGLAGLLHASAGPAARLGASRFLNGAALVLLKCIVATTALGLRIPGSCFAAQFRPAWVGPASLAALLAACIAGYAGRWRRGVGGGWPPFAIVTLALVFGAQFGVNHRP